MARRSQPVGIKRRTPRQTRAEETVAAIIEAAAQVLEATGLKAFTTNAVAERAGVSIGTLYQYFADKHAILAAAARRELGEGASLAERQRALIEALIAMVESLGRLGGGAASAPLRRRTADRPSVSPKRRGDRWERRCADFAHELMELLLPAPQPALRPIPITGRRR